MLYLLSTAQKSRHDFTLGKEPCEGPLTISPSVRRGRMFHARGIWEWSRLREQAVGSLCQDLSANRYVLTVKEAVPFKTQLKY